ncbi:MAG: hypothetical protein VB070_10480 [Clostridiaceae bacterium]|nr:hypothetical protein [Clostridiaceae bacterium]
MTDKEKIPDDRLQQVSGGGWGMKDPFRPVVPIFRFSRFAPAGQKDEQGRELCANRQNYPDCGGCTDFCENGWRSNDDWRTGH